MARDCLTKELITICHQLNKQDKTSVFSGDHQQITSCTLYYIVLVYCCNQGNMSVLEWMFEWWWMSVTLIHHHSNIHSKTLILPWLHCTFLEIKLLSCLFTHCKVSLGQNELTNCSLNKMFTILQTTVSNISILYQISLWPNDGISHLSTKVLLVEAMNCCLLFIVAEKVNTILAKTPQNFNGSLDKCWLTSIVNWDKIPWQAITWINADQLSTAHRQNKLECNFNKHTHIFFLKKWKYCLQLFSILFRSQCFNFLLFPQGGLP